MKFLKIFKLKEKKWSLEKHLLDTAETYLNEYTISKKVINESVPKLRLILGELDEIVNYEESTIDEWVDCSALLLNHVMTYMLLAAHLEKENK